MKTKRTPGPYPLRMDCGRNPDMFVIVTNQGNHYATTYDPSAARLIIAAHDLLAACKRVLKDDYDSRKTFDILRAAINKAEGRP